MFETTKLSPVYNGYQYLIVFLVGIVLNLVIYFFSSRKYYALTTRTDAIGFAPELMIYYRSLGKKGPFPSSGSDSFYNTCNSLLMGSLIAGTMCIIVVLLTDLILQAIDYRNSIT
jgi:hypothetical protein